MYLSKNLPANAETARHMGLIPELGRSHGGENANPLQCSCLENPRDRGACRPTIHGTTKNWTRLSSWVHTQSLPFDLWVCVSVPLLLLSCSVLSDSLRSSELHTRLPCPSPYPRACSSSCPLSWWCHPTILSSVVPFSCLQSFLHQGLFKNESVLFFFFFF